MAHTQQIRQIAELNKVMPTNQIEANKNIQTSLDHFISQVASKANENNPVQWVQWLESLDNKSQNGTSRGSKIESGLNTNVRQKENIFLNTSPIQGSTKGTSLFSKGLQNSNQSVQSLRLPGERERYLSGWPLLSSKAQLSKCEKCSAEFCSSVNYRRHIRMHRRQNVEKEDSSKERSGISSFWDKISAEEAKEIVSIDNISLKELPGTSIVRELSSFIHQPAICAFPQNYIKAGASLLDFVQMNFTSSLAAKDLFSILDDASERTFLFAGTSDSVQKIVFQGEAGTLGLEAKNLIASLAFMVEQRLVKAWIADKDAEALRFQKELVEEEEAFQKKKAELLEKKRLKKLRQRIKDKKTRKRSATACEGFTDSEATDGINEAVDRDCTVEPMISSPNLSNGHSCDAASFETSQSEEDVYVNNIHFKGYADVERAIFFDAEALSVEETGESESHHHSQNGYCKLETLDSLYNSVGDQDAILHMSSKQKNQDKSVPPNGRSVHFSSDRHISMIRRKGDDVADSSSEYSYINDSHIIDINSEPIKLETGGFSSNSFHESKSSPASVSPRLLVGDAFDRPKLSESSQGVVQAKNGYKLTVKMQKEFSVDSSSDVAEANFEAKNVDSNYSADIGDGGQLTSPEYFRGTASKVLLESNQSCSLVNSGTKGSLEGDKIQEENSSQSVSFSNNANKQSIPNKLFIGSMSVSFGNYVNVEPLEHSAENNTKGDGVDSSFSSKIGTSRGHSGTCNENKSLAEGFVHLCTPKDGLKVDKEVSKDASGKKSTRNQESQERNFKRKNSEGCVKGPTVGNSESFKALHPSKQEYSNSHVSVCYFLSERWEDAMADASSVIYSGSSDETTNNVGIPLG